MNKKALLFTQFFLFFILFTGIAGVSNVALTGSSPPTISLPPTCSAVPMFQNVALNLSIYNVTDLYLWVATIQWNSTNLNLTSYSEGQFLRQGGSTTFIVGKLSPGKIEGLTCSLHGNFPGVNGNGTLATLQFNGTGIGWTSIDIAFSDLLDSSGNSMAHYAVNSTAVVFRSTGGGGGGRMPYMQ